MLKTGLLPGVIAALIFVGCGDNDPLSSSPAADEGPPAAADDSRNGVAPGEPNPGGALSYSRWKADLPEDLNKDGMVDRADFVLYLEKRPMDGGPITNDDPDHSGGDIEPAVDPVPVDDGGNVDPLIDPVPVDDGGNIEPSVDPLPVDDPHEPPPVIKVAVRGHITAISAADASAQERGIIGSVLVEGPIEQDTSFDRAAVEITKTTRISKRAGPELQAALFAALQVGQRVEATFTGTVRESYPVQVAAMEFIILE